MKARLKAGTQAQFKRRFRPTKNHRSKERRFRKRKTGFEPATLNVGGCEPLLLIPWLYKAKESLGRPRFRARLKQLFFCCWFVVQASRDALGQWPQQFTHVGIG